MNPKFLFIAAGFIWGIVLGIAAVMVVVPMAAGFAWLFLFGDDPWPDWAEAAIMLVGATAGVSVFVTCIVLGWYAGRRFDDGMPDTRRRMQAAAWAVSGMLALAVGMAAIWNESARLDQHREQTADRLDSFEMLSADTHRISGIAVDWPGGGRDGRATLTTTGRRNGSYRLTWRVRDQAYGKPLLDGVLTAELTNGTGQTEVVLPALDLVAGYRALLTQDNASILVDEPFVFEARLSPILTAAERASAPANELQNLRLDGSELIDGAEAGFPVRFYLFAGQLSWTGR